MSLLPRSLFNRLVVVLVTGLVIAQLSSFAIYTRERGQLLSQASGMQSAQRITDIVKLLETLTPAERRGMVQGLSAPPLTISLDQSPLAVRDEDADKGARAALFGALLRRLLADGWPVVVNVTDGVPFRPGEMRGLQSFAMKGGDWMPPRMLHSPRPGLSFVAQARLHDGTLVTFDTRQFAETANWPYRRLLSLAILFAAVVGVSLIAVRWATRPINALAIAAAELGKNINRPPLLEKGPLEVARAASAFNAMQARLLRFLQDRARILAAMSHDLKTPITRLRLRSALLEEPQLREKFTRDIEEMEAMVGATLDFMRGLETDESERPVDVMALLESLQTDMLEMGGQVRIEAGRIKPYPGKPRALRRCLTNLLDNAIKYGKSALVIVDSNDDRLEIRILDEGPGLPQPELEKVFDPFYRWEGSRNRNTGGTGLGLTIARCIAEDHGGKLTLRNRPEGGLEASLTMPLAGASVLKTHGP